MAVAAVGLGSMLATSMRSSSVTAVHTPVVQTAVGPFASLETMDLRTSQALERLNEFQQQAAADSAALAARRPGSEAVTPSALPILFDSVPISHHVVRLKPRSRGPGGGDDRGRKGVSEAGSDQAGLR